LVSVLILYEPITSSIQYGIETTTETGTFMLSFVPILSSVIAGMGGITSASAYNLIVIYVAEIAVQLSTSVLLPILSLSMALSVIDAITPNISLGGLIEGIKKGGSWALGLSMTFFAGLLSLQSLITNSADGLTVKTGKYMASNFIPVVGGAIADAYGTLRNSLGLIKNGLGGVGIIVVIIMVMPSIITIGLNRIVFFGAQIMSDMFNVPELAGLFKNISAVTTVLFVAVVSFAVMFIISTALIMAIIGN
jgi:stage III sporulation protein AE